MDSLVLNEYSTEFTTVFDRIESRVDSSGHTGLFRVVNSTKTITNIDQMEHIIHYLVVMNGFLMEKHSTDMILFLHPKNCNEEFASYTYYPSTRMVEKYESKFISYI
jgi:hypothetical protein